MKNINISILNDDDQPIGGLLTDDINRAYDFMTIPRETDCKIVMNHRGTKTVYKQGYNGTLVRLY